MRLLTRHGAEVGAWMGERMGVRFVPPFEAIGITDDNGSLIGGWLLNGWNHANADLTIYGPGALTRRTIRACYAHLFLDLKATRVTARTRRDNQTMRDLLPRLGFQFESLARRYYGPNRRHDAFVYALFPDNAKNWLSPPTLDVGNRRFTDTIPLGQV